MTRTCLMVAYYFPPGGGVGVQRSLKFAKYLPEYDWRPAILTAEDPLGIPRDEALLGQIPNGAVVYRAKPMFSTTRCFDRNRGIWDRLFTAALMIPDPLIPWVPSAVRLGRQAIDREHVKVIYTTSPPHSSHFAGVSLKRETGLPWVADFRDAWLTDPDRNRSIHNRLRAATVEEWQERWVVQNADRIITVSEPIRADFLTRYPRLSPHRVVVITNGFDPEDFTRMERRREANFTFVFTGTMSAPNRGPEPLLDGARTLLANYPQFANRFRILLIGHYTEGQAKLPALYGLDSHVRFVGVVPHHEALSYQVNADANVFVYHGPVDGRSAQMMSGKLFDYMGAGRPILALAPSETSAVRLVERLHLGKAAMPDSPSEIAKAMYTMLTESPQARQYAPQLHAFERRYLTRQLADVFEAVTTS